MAATALMVQSLFGSRIPAIGDVFSQSLSFTSSPLSPQLICFIKNSCRLWQQTRHSSVRVENYPTHSYKIANHIFLVTIFPRRQQRSAHRQLIGSSQCTRHCRRAFTGPSELRALLTFLQIQVRLLLPFTCAQLNCFTLTIETLAFITSHKVLNPYHSERQADTKLIQHHFLTIAMLCFDQTIRNHFSVPILDQSLSVRRTAGACQSRLFCGVKMY